MKFLNALVYIILLFFIITVILAPFFNLEVWKEWIGSVGIMFYVIGSIILGMLIIEKVK